MLFKDAKLNVRRDQIDAIKDRLKETTPGVRGEETQNYVAEGVLSEEQIQTVIAADDIIANFAFDFEVAHSELSAGDFIADPSRTESVSSVNIGKRSFNAKTTAHKVVNNSFAKEGQPTKLDRFLNTTVDTKGPAVYALKSMRKSMQAEFTEQYAPIHDKAKQA